MRKLTDRQAELLAAMRSGVRVYYTHPFYWRGDTHRKCTPEAKALLGLGLVEKFTDSSLGHRHKLMATTTEPIKDVIP
jgi:predicted nuclease with RNAse H fold